MELSFDDRYVVITQNNISEYTEIIEKMGYSKKSFQSLFVDGSLVAFILHSESKSQIQIKVIETQFSQQTKSLSYIKEEKIAQVAEKYGLHITLQPASSSEIAKDVIFAQDIAPGTKIAKGSDVTLTYSKGASTVTLPNFTGVPITETVYYLGKLNLSYNIVEKANSGGQTPGHVATMSPAAGSIVYEGTEITIEIWGDPAGSQDITGPNTGSQITSSDSIIDSIIGSLGDSVSGLGSTIQSFFG